MKHASVSALALACTCALLLSTTASAQGRGGVAGGVEPIGTELLANGFNYPTQVLSAPGDTCRLFLLEKPGRIKVINLPDGSVNPTNYLTITSLIAGGTSQGDERGLLGMAFDPDYENNRFVYVNYTDTSATNNTRIVRYTTLEDFPDRADSTSAHPIMTIQQPSFTNHNGGWIGFGPDGYLYVGTGDGGSGCDPANNAQTITSLLGKMLRIDVHGDDFPADSTRNYAVPSDNPFVGVAGADEIWAYGLRNPWRNSFDTATGDLYIGDVGQNAREEVNVQPVNTVDDYQGGKNYGWDCEEGFACAPCSAGCVCGAAGHSDPVHDYPHTQGLSITGGFVYRGSAIPSLQGQYFFADYAFGNIWTCEWDGAGGIIGLTNRSTELDPGPGSITAICSFGTDGDGEIYLVEHNGANGEVYKVVPDSPSATSDADLDGDGSVGPADLASLLGDWGAMFSPADLNCDLNVDPSDLATLLGEWG